MNTLIDLKAPKPRFARSINIERDTGSDAIDGYLPVGRAIDAITRLAYALESPGSEVALSVTGPYGSGKSSLAVIIDALVGPKDSPERRSADGLLAAAAPNALEALVSARDRLEANASGFIRAVATAQREPIPATVLRALLHGAARFTPSKKQKAAFDKAVTRVRDLQRAYLGDKAVRPETRDMRAAIAGLAQFAPVLLLIDEFGKNLEAFADSHSDADLYLLQELAEWSRGEDGIPLALVTMQHMAFDEYADGASAAQRREWAKIQGRFEDIPFVDSPAQTRALIAASFGPAAEPLGAAVADWTDSEVEMAAALGLNDLTDPDLVGSCWPLHPLAVAALPELCERYGQNERTLFSFLASHEPRSVASWLADTSWNIGEPLPVVRLDRVYDYFLESAATMVGVSNAASRWVEIDTRIRDAHGVHEATRRVLKTIGLLNLVSAGGSLRASKALLVHACVDGQQGTTDRAEVAEQLATLESLGLITFRDFADEYRVWQGSDFDLRTAIDIARRRLRDEPAADILNRVLPLGPLVAARHSHRTGTLRAFARAWTTPDAAEIEPLGSTDREDGTALYVLGDAAPGGSVSRRPDGKPVAFITTNLHEPLIDAAREVAALDEVLGDPDSLGDDWVARRELYERRVEARQVLDVAFETAFGSTSPHRGDWTYVKPTKTRRTATTEATSASQALSDVADAWYRRAPTIANDLINRHELSSQAAKARREMLESLLLHADVEFFAIDGHGPDNTLYRSVIQAHGMHRHNTATGQWELAEPKTTSSLSATWERITDLLQSATSDRLRVDDIYTQLAAPPHGLRAGVSPILLVVALQVHSEEVAVYEHGTFRPVLTDDVLERLLRNPGNFEVKHFATRSGSRAEFLTMLADALGIRATRGQKNGRVGSVLAVLSHLVATVNTLPSYVRNTKNLDDDTLAVRAALVEATEPDELLFTSIPEALGHERIQATNRTPKKTLEDLTDRIYAAVEQLRHGYPNLLASIRSALEEDLSVSGDLQAILRGRALEIQDKIIDPKVKQLSAALATELDDEPAWLEYVAMMVTDTPPNAWTDQHRDTFFTLLRDIAGTFRRVYALNANLTNNADGFDALRIAVTRPDGTERIDLVAVSHAQREKLTGLLDEVLDTVQAQTSSRAEARDVLLALLADPGTAPDASANIKRAVTPEEYGDDGGNLKAGQA